MTSNYTWVTIYLFFCSEFNLYDKKKAKWAEQKIQYPKGPLLFSKVRTTL